MRDIRKPYRNSKSNNVEILNRKSKTSSFDEFDSKIMNRRDISHKAEMFEKNEYEDIDYTRDGKPIMRASSHYDLNKKKRRDDFDVLKRAEFFNSNRRDFDESDLKEYKKAKNKKKKTRKIFLYFILILLIGAFFVFTFIFDKSIITINPKYKDVDINSTFLIFKEDLILDISSTTLSKTILKSEPKEVNEKASGEITIYNNYSENPQTLIKNTRFQTADGKVFRIGDSIKVPGKNGNTPGTIKVKVSADTYGADYNIGPTDFTIPGFKNSERYDKFYAKSESNMTGGASGRVQIVAESDINNANLELKPKVEAELASTTNKITHDNYYTLYGEPIINFTDNKSDLSVSSGNVYNLTGVSSIFSIKKDILAKMIAIQALGDDYNGQDLVKLENIDNLNFELAKDTTGEENILRVNITGKVRIIWDFDQEEFKAYFLNKNKSDFNNMIKKYNYAILSATLKQEPIWNKSFPNSKDKIKIIEEIK